MHVSFKNWGKRLAVIIKVITKGVVVVVAAAAWLVVFLNVAIM